MLDRQRIRTFLLGGLAGVVAGMLFAPRSGKETRGSLTTGAGDARERGRETLFGARERLAERRAARRDRAPTDTAVVETAPRATDADPSFGADPDAGPEAPVQPLREVPRYPFEDEPRGAGASSEAGVEPEEVRRRIQETRSRLRERLARGESEGGTSSGPSERPGAPDEEQEDV